MRIKAKRMFSNKEVGGLNAGDMAEVGEQLGAALCHAGLAEKVEHDAERHPSENPAIVATSGQPGRKRPSRRNRQ